VKKEISAMLLALAITSLALQSFSLEAHPLVSTVFASSSTDIMVYYINVGQGDSILIKVENRTILIDGGPKAASTTVLNYLSSVNVTNIDFMVATHPHEDHIGGLTAVLQSIQVNEVLYNGYNYTTKVFQDFMDLAQYHNLTIVDRGQFFSLTSTANFTILNPHQPLVSADLNENSIVLKLKVSNVSFLFTGDATVDSEQSMLNASLSLQSDVLKVGHHGSNTSTSQAFLNAVNPSYAVISCGINNTYGHPHIETIQKLLNKGITIYGTYVSGNIIFSTNGNTITIQDMPQAIPEFSSAFVTTMMLLTIVVAAFILHNKKS
jgi:competence protein ComEC